MDSLRDLVYRGFETRDVDYKAPCAWRGNDDRRASCELVRDVLALANSGGGQLVIGVDEPESGRFEQTGVPEADAVTWDSTDFNRYVNQYADPPVNSEVFRFEHDGRLFMIIRVPDFPRTPHLCIRQYPGVLEDPCLYVRTAQNSTERIRSSADFREIIDRAVRRNQDYLLESFRAILTGSQSAETNVSRYDADLALSRSRCQENFPEKYRLRREKLGRGYEAFWVTYAYPGSYVEERFSPSQGKRMCQAASITYRGWPFIFVSKDATETRQVDDGVESVIVFPDFNRNDTYDFWRLFLDGFFYHTVLFREHALEQRVVWMFELILHPAEALDAIMRLYDQFVGPNEPITVAMELHDMQGRILSDATKYDDLARDGHTCASRTITYKKTRTLADWKAGIADHVAEIYTHICERFNFEASSEYAKAQVDKLFSRRLNLGG